MVAGRTVAENGRTVDEQSAGSYSPDQALLDTVRLKSPLTESDFHIPIQEGRKMKVIEMIPNHLETRKKCLHRLLTRFVLIQIMIY